MSETNPKDAIGRQKPGMSAVPANVLAEIGAVMQGGAAKYGRHNWRRAGIAASVYYDACLRHLFQWWEGEDIDPESGLPHLAHAVAGLVILRDAMARGMAQDDRPEPSPAGWLLGLSSRGARHVANDGRG